MQEVYCINVFDLTLDGVGLGVDAVATSTTVVVVDGKFLGKGFGVLHSRPKRAKTARSSDIDERRTATVDVIASVVPSFD